LKEKPRYKINRSMKIFTGKIISTKMKDTATVLVDSVFMHKLYGKRYTRTKKYHVHDESGLQVGDSVSFVACRPYSKIKRWRTIDLKKNSDKEVQNSRREGGAVEKELKPVIKRKSNRKIK